MLRTTTVRNRILLIVSGVLLGVSFPPFGIAGGFCAFFALVPLLIALEDTTRLRNALTRGYLGMFVLTLIATYWVGGWKGEGKVDSFLLLAGIALDLVHPLFLVVPILLYDATRRRFGRLAALVALPVYWIGFEYWHSTGDLAFPWLSLYNTQTYNRLFIQFIDITGSYGISLVVLVANVLIYSILRLDVLTGSKVAKAGSQTGLRRAVKYRLGLALVFLLAIPYIYGMINDHATHKGDIGITIVQPNINPWDKWSTGTQAITDSMERATRTALKKSGPTDLILWPETAITYPITLPWRMSDLRNLYRFVDEIGTPILTGIPDREEYIKGRDVIPADSRKTSDPNSFHRDWNSAMLFGEDLSSKPYFIRYHKQKLVPFGEKVPFVEELPFLGDIFQWGVGLGSWNGGEGYPILSMPLRNHTQTAPDSARLCSMICYESVYPSYVREYVKRGAQLITIITNDGWYGKSSGPYQHEQYAVLRAIENRRWVARSANTGISSVIDDRGNIHQETPLFESTSISARIPLLDEQTIYTKLGDFIAVPCEWASGGMLLLFGVLRILRRKRKE